MPETGSQRPEASNQKAGARGSVNRDQAAVKPDARDQMPVIRGQVIVRSEPSAPSDSGQRPGAVKLRMATGTVTGLKQMPETSKQRPRTESASLDADSRQKSV